MSKISEFDLISGNFCRIMHILKNIPDFPSSYTYNSKTMLKKSFFLLILFWIYHSENEACTHKERSNIVYYILLQKVAAVRQDFCKMN